MSGGKITKNVDRDEKVTFLCSLNLLLLCSVLTQNPLLLSTVALFSDDPGLLFGAGWCKVAF